MAKPLQDVVISTTYISDNVEADIQDQVHKLGGKFRKAVDASLNFLITGERFTEKYNFAVAHGATLISADTFFDVYLEWKAGGEIDFVPELRARALKPMEGLIISTTNLSTDQKDGFRELIEAGGGVYSKDLIKKCRVLVSPELKGKKAMVAPSWHIPVVHPKWVSESLRVKAALDPTCFNLHIPEAEMGVKMSIPAATPAPSEDRPAPIPKRRKSDLLFGVARRSSTLGVPAGPVAGPAGSPADSSAAALPSHSTLPSLQPGAALFPQPGTRLALFTGKSFSLSGFDSRQTRILRRTIESHMGKISPDNSHYVLVSSTAPHTRPVRSPSARVITEWAIERSLDHKTPALDDDWGQPVYTRPTAGFTGLAVCVSGFTGIEQRHVVELIKLMGATFAETLTRSRDLLIARSPTARKVSYATQWDVPVATVEWLWQSALAGRALPVAEEHAMDGKGARPPPRPRAHEATARPSASISSLRKRSMNDVNGGSDQNEDHTGNSGEDNVGYHDEDAEARARLLIALGEKPATPPPAEPATLPAVTHKVSRRAGRH